MYRLPWYLSPCQSLALAWLPPGPSNLFIFIKRNIRCLFLPDTANPVMNMPVKMKMKARVNYLLEHSAGQINSNIKKQGETHYRRLDLSMCWSEKLFTGFIGWEIKLKCTPGPNYSYNTLVWNFCGEKHYGFSNLNFNLWLSVSWQNAYHWPPFITELTISTSCVYYVFIFWSNLETINLFPKYVRSYVLWINLIYKHIWLNSEHFCKF